MSNFFDNRNLLELVYKWKTHLTIIVVTAIILGVIFSGSSFITPLYKSYGVVYPANITSYSEESNTEQMLQIFNSQDIADSMIACFHLGEHYDISKDYKYYRTALLNEYKEKVKISKTPYESVLIEVYDKSPEQAKQMVDRLIYYYNQKVDLLHKEKYEEVVVMIGKQLGEKKSLLDSLKKVKAELGENEGIFEYNYQSQEITKGYLGTVDGSGNSINKKEAKRLFENMSSHSGSLIELDKMINDEAGDYVTVKRDYELAKRFLESDLTYTNVITHPFVADKKSYPIRWLVVVIVALAAFVFSILVIFLIENINRKNT
jgi:hypothetical protein